MRPARAAASHHPERPPLTQWTLIANPAAGNGHAARVVARCAHRLRRAGRDVSVRLTGQRGDALQQARAAVDTGAEALVVCGGDGTVAEVLPALAGSDTALGLVPCGTGNDLARALGIPRTPRRAITDLLEEQPQPMDLGRCGDRWFATVAAFGFDAEVNRIVDDGPGFLSGTPAYLWATLKHLRAYQPSRVRVTGDFPAIETELFLAAVAITRSYGGGLRIAPHADPEDGRFDLCLVDGSLTPGRALALLPKLLWGGHLGAAPVRLLRTTWVGLEPLTGGGWLYADGEGLAAAPAMLQVEPGALRVIRRTAAPRGPDDPARVPESP